MSLSVLEVVKSFCYETNIPPPSTLVGATDPATNQLIYLFYAVCRDLRQAKCWPQLKKTYTFTTSNGVSTYAMPGDFFCSLLDTYWDTTNKWKLAGPQTDSRYNDLLYGYATFSNRIYFRVFGQLGTNEFSVQPTPGTSPVTVSFDYLTKNYLGTGAAPYTWSEAIVLDADICAFDDDLLILGLKCKWYQMKGLDYTALQAEYNAKIDSAQGRWQGNKKTTLYAQNPLLAGLNPNIQEGSWTL